MVAPKWKTVDRPQPPMLDLGGSTATALPSSVNGVSPPVSVQLNGVMIQSGGQSPSSRTPTAGPTQSFGSLPSSAGSSMPVSGMKTTTARQAVLSAGQYPPGVGWTPTAKQAGLQLPIGFSKAPSVSPTGSPNITCKSPTGSMIMQSPTGSMIVQSPKSTVLSGASLPQGSVVMQSPKSIASTVIVKKAYPPGLGFTPMAAAGVLPSKNAYKQLDRFCLSEGSKADSVSATPPAGGHVVATPSHLMRAASTKFQDEGLVEKELFLIFRDVEATAELTPEEAGFLLPQPGWILTYNAQELSPAAKKAPAKPATAKSSGAAKPKKAAAKPAAAPPKAAAAARSAASPSDAPPPPPPPPQFKSQLQATAAAFVPSGQRRVKADAGQQILGTGSPPGQWMGTQPPPGHLVDTTMNYNGGFQRPTPSPSAANLAARHNQIFSAAMATQSLGSQQFAEALLTKREAAAIRAFTENAGSQRMPRRAASPTQSLGAMSYPTGYGQPPGPVFQQPGKGQARQPGPIYQQYDPAEAEWWAQTGGPPNLEQGDTWQLVPRDGAWSGDQQCQQPQVRKMRAKAKAAQAKAAQAKPAPEPATGRYAAYLQSYGNAYMNQSQA